MTVTSGAATYPDHLRREVEDYLGALEFPTAEPATEGLQEAMRYSLLAGGKRIRPVLALATANAVELEQPVLPLAAGLGTGNLTDAATDLASRLRSSSGGHGPGAADSSGDRS